MEGLDITLRKELPGLGMKKSETDPERYSIITEDKDIGTSQKGGD